MVSGVSGNVAGVNLGQVSAKPAVQNATPNVGSGEEAGEINDSPAEEAAEQSGKGRSVNLLA